MERIMSMAYEPLQERSSASDAMLPSRSLGVAVNNSILNQRLTWAGGVFNDWLDRGESFSRTDNQFVGRITGVPFVSSDWSNLLHVAFGARYANARQDVQYRTEPEVEQAPLFADTGPIPANGVLTYNLEATWRKGPFWLAYEYIYSDVDSEDCGSLDFYGQHIAASWALTGEMRPYRRRSGVLGALPVAKSVNQGGWGAWEAAARYSKLDLTDGPIDGGQLDIYTLGLNWWLTPYSSLSVNYRNITLDRFDEEGTSNALTGRLTLILE
jgi:phosphate-selective porin OprO/OprP